MPVLVTGEIEFPQGTAPFSGATAYISLESVGMIDMPSTVVVEQTLNNVSYGGSNLSFELNGTVDENSGGLNMRVHISMQGSDDVQKGDYLNKRTYTVLKNGYPDKVTVAVDEV